MKQRTGLTRLWRYTEGRRRRLSVVLGLAAVSSAAPVVGWHIARVLAPQEMRDALRSEAGYYGGSAPVVEEFGFHGPSETGADRQTTAPDNR